MTPYERELVGMARAWLQRARRAKPTLSGGIAVVRLASLASRALTTNIDAPLLIAAATEAGFTVEGDKVRGLSAKWIAAQRDAPPPITRRDVLTLARTAKIANRTALKALAIGADSLSCFDTRERVRVAARKLGLDVR